MLNPKYRFVYVVGGVAFFLFLIYNLVSNPTEFNPKDILKCTVPSLFFFGLAYKTYPRNYKEHK